MNDDETIIPGMVMELLLFSFLFLLFSSLRELWGKLLKQHELKHQKHVVETSLNISSSLLCISIVIVPKSCAYMRSVYK